MDMQCNYLGEWIYECGSGLAPSFLLTPSCPVVVGLADLTFELWLFWVSLALLALIDEGARLRHVGVIRVFHQPPINLDEIEQLHLIAVVISA